MSTRRSAELQSILRSPDDPVALIDAILDAQDCWDPELTSLALALVGHPDVDVRRALSQELPWAGASVIGALVTLSADREPDVRDAACFGLGQLEADSPEVCDALAARLHDIHVDTRGEALVALAKTGDERALPVIRQRLARNPDNISMLELVAAAEYADPELMPELQRLRQAWANDRDAHTEALDYAIRRCEPAAYEQATDLERRLTVGVRERVAFDIAGRYPRTTARVGDHASRIWTDVDPSTFDLQQQIASWILTAG